MSIDFGSTTPPHRFSLPQSPWLRAAVALALALSALMVIYRSTVVSIVTSWSKDPFAHGYIVVPLALYLVWQRRDDLKPITPSVAYLALPAIALCASLWLLGHLADTGLVRQVSLIGMMSGFVWLILGWPTARVLIYPMASLIFALPIGDRLVPALQDLAARCAVSLLAFSDVPVLLQAHVISIPGSTWKVAEACSGINYLTASLAIGYVYAGTAYRYWSHRIGFVLGAALVPLFGNGIRVYGTILLASKAGPESVAGTRHFLFGWLVFALMMALLFVVCGRWREESNGTPTARKPNPERAFAGARAICTAVGLVIVAAAPVSTHSDEHRTESITHPTPPTVSLPWIPTEANRYSWTPHFEKPGLEFLQSYQSDQRMVKMFIASYSDSHTGRTLAGGANALVPEPWWITGNDQRTVTVQGQSITVRETFVEGPSTPLLVWNWYWVDGRFTDSDYLARLYLAKAGLFRRSRAATVVAIATENRPGLEPQAVLQDFLLHLSLPPTPISRRVALDRVDNFHSDSHP